MGKNRIVRILGKLIAGMIAHRILEKYSNKKESLNHLRMEVNNYRDNIYEYFKKFNWNTDDKKRIKEKTLKNLKSEFKKPHFSDVKFPMNEAEKFIDETLKEIFVF
ncbi:MAG: hypothetical protein AABX54_01365 [Nanoarchaeota archaeon]